jgi:hypothetical protein
VQAMKAVLRRPYVKVIVPFHASAVLLPMRRATIAVEEGVEWPSESACVLWRRGQLSSAFRNRTMVLGLSARINCITVINVSKFHVFVLRFLWWSWC